MFLVQTPNTESLKKLSNALLLGSPDFSQAVRAPFLELTKTISFKNFYTVDGLPGVL